MWWSVKPPATTSHWPLLAVAGLVTAGLVGPVVQPYARVALLVVLGLLVLGVLVARPSRFVGGLVAFLFLTDTRVDWRTLRRTLLVVAGLGVVAFLPHRWWVLTTAAGVGMLGGAAVRRFGRVPAGMRRLPTLPAAPSLEWWGAARFRLRYRMVAAELGWDRDRKGSSRDRRQVPGLAEARLRDGVWTVVLVSRGDWGPDRWEREAWALARILGGRSVRWRMDGLRVVIQVHTRDLPAPGEITVTEPPRCTGAGLLVGHDAARRPVHWAADDTSPHLLGVGSTGGGKSTLAALLLVQAACSEGWEAVMLDCKETRSWEWLRAWGVVVIRRRPEIHGYLRGLEAERRRIEDAGGDSVRRLVVVDEARLVLGTHAGQDRDQRRETIGVVGDLTSLGRSAGYRIVPLIQRPDVEHVGGGFLRDNLPARVALGRLEPDGAAMVFAGRTTSPEELALLDGTPGRALVSGLRGGDSDVNPLQVPRLTLPHREAPAAPVPVQLTLDDRVAAAVPEAGAPRADVARQVGVDPKGGDLRRAVARLVRAGVLVEGRDARGRVVLSRGAGVGAGGVPPATQGASTSPATPPGEQQSLPGVPAAA